MPLEIIPFIIGPVVNNTYLVFDPQEREAAVIDPAQGSELLLPELQNRNLRLTSIWLTHAHFDHILGVNDLLKATKHPVAIGLHPMDLDLWRSGGGARYFGISPIHMPSPTLLFSHDQHLNIGTHTLTVIHTPGHTPGHVAFYSQEAGVVFCGDLIFQRGIGRTDLPGGNLSTLLHSIRTFIFTLPPQTRLLSGHGLETTVQEEVEENPFF
jgi:hydroxyacylglutathione hydrolase